MYSFYDYPADAQVKMQMGGGADEQQQLMQIIQMYAQMKGQDPKQVIQQLQQLDPAAQKQALQQIVSEIQAASQQQGAAQQQAAPMMQRMGGQSFNPGTYSDGYSGTYSGSNYFNNGGSFVPSYGDSAYNNMMMYGGGMSDGGIVIGEVYDADPTMLQQLKAGGYTYEIVND